MSKSASKLGGRVTMACWMSSDQMQGKYSSGHSGVEVIPDEAPCTPMQSFPRQKHQSDETPECMHSLPSLSLGFGSLESQNEQAVLGLQNHGSSYSSEQRSSQQIYSQEFQSRSQQCAASTCKNFNRIQLEMQREGLELHKENLLSLSLSKIENVKPPQNSDSSLHCSGHPPSHRIFANLGGSKMPSLPEGLHFQQGKFQQVPSCPQHMHVYNASSLSFDNDFPVIDKAGRGMSTASGSVALLASSNTGFGDWQLPERCKLATHTPFPDEATMKFLPGGSCFQMKVSTSSMDSQHFCKPDHGLKKFHIPYTASVSHAAPTGVVNQVSLASQSRVEGLRVMQLLPAALNNDMESMNGEENGHLGSGKSGIAGKRQQPCSSQVQQQRVGPCYNEKSMPNFVVEDAVVYHRAAKKATKKKRQAAAGQLNTPFCKVEVAEPSAVFHDQTRHSPSMQDEYLRQKEYMKKHIIFTDEIEDMKLPNLRVSLTEKREENNAAHIATTTLRHDQTQSQELQNDVQAASSSLVDAKNGTFCSAPSVVKHSGQQPFESSREEANRESVGLKLFAISAYAYMPKVPSTFSTGDPSLPLSLEPSQKPLESTERNTLFQQLETPSDADWGKFLALSAVPMTIASDMGSGNMVPYQQRFKKLQSFLKQCDESDRKEQLQALRSLTAAARSGHAVELETRAIKLSLEEGKEMNRMKMLNVLGRENGKNANDEGATPHGPKLPAPGAPTILKHL